PDEADRLARLDRLEKEQAGKRFERTARRGDIVDEVAVDTPVEFVDLPDVDAVVAEDGADEVARAEAAEAPGQPVPGLVVLPVRPHVGPVRKRRIRPRVPGPDMDRRRLDHPPAID